MEIVAYRPEYFGELLSFIREQYPTNALKGTPSYFQWRFDQNPLGTSLDNYQLAIDNGRIVGQLGAIRDQMWAKGRWWNCHWLIDMLVDPEHRGPRSTVVPRLFQAAMKGRPLLMSTGGGPTQLRFYKAMGWQYREVFGSYYAVRRPARLLALAQEAGEKRPLLKPLLPVAGLAMTALQSAGRMWHRMHAHSFEFDRLDHFGEETRDLIERVLPSIPVTSHRSSPYLNWKFNQRPAGTHFVVTARRKGASQIDGYIAVKIMERSPYARWAEIVDFLTAPNDSRVFEALLYEATRHALKVDVDFLRLRCSLQEQQALLKSPFWIRRDRPVIDGTFFRAEDAELNRYFATEGWHLTSLVSDRADQGCDEFTADLQPVPRGELAANWRGLARHVDRTS